MIISLTNRMIIIKLIIQKKILLLLKYTISILNKWWAKFNIPIIQNEDYQSLTPIDNADEDSTYENAILWALENRNTKNIRNIALTGSYGSGKSSIIKTFQKKYEESEYKFLNISLATFKDENNDNNTTDDGLLRLIELSILQQIFYHVENHKIPDSRFKKINSIGNKKLEGYSAALIIWLISIFIVFVPILFYNLFRLKICEVDVTVLTCTHYTALIIMLIGVYQIIKKSIRIFNNSKINKLNIQSGEIEINKEIDKSILNNHLDEILYFFEVNPFNVLVIEDLDRFGQTEIFTKLRELNNLINNSKQVNKEVVFIYAVRDDMFKDKDRTKFFDFIIPIIPVINSSNSNDILFNKLQVSNTNLSTDLIDDISLFIDDMRLLNNVINEYIIYQKKLSNKLSENKLLGMIVYKNIHPEDFVNLHNNAGKIYEVINKKQEFIKNEVSKVENEISDLEDKIDDINNEHFDDVNELRKLYILEYINGLTGIKSFSINGNIVDFRAACSDVNFDYFVKNNVSYNYLSLNYSNYYNDLTNKVQLKFSDVEYIVNSEFTYLDRLEFLGDKREENIVRFSKKIKELKDKISSIKSASLKDVLNNSQTTIIESEKDNRLINILLRGGYIDEDYYDYISHFYEGSLTREDRDFLINVKSQYETNYDFKLNKIGNVVKKLKDGFFEKPQILNYDLLDYLLENSNNTIKLDIIIKQLSNESKISLTFIDGFIDISKNKAIFIKILCKNWKNIWEFIESKSNYLTERKDLYFKSILEFSEQNCLKSIVLNSKITEYTSNRSDILSFDIEEKQLKECIKTINPKFKNLENINTNLNLFDFIYNGNFYDINEVMIKLILASKSKDLELNIDESNYSSIQKSGCTDLIIYVDKNIESYIQNVFLKLSDNSKEEEAYLLNLLNNEKLSIELKEKIISFQELKISNIYDLNENEVAEMLLVNSKLTPTWKNVIDYYENIEEKVDESILVFLNNIENVTALKKSKIPYIKENRKLIENLSSGIILSEEIENKNYNQLIDSIPFIFPQTLNFIKLSHEKVEILITNKKLIFKQENYDLIRDNFDKLHIKFLENYIEDYLESFDEYTIDGVDLSELIVSSEFSVDQKIELLEKCDESLISTIQNNINLVSDFVITNTFSVISNSLLECLVTKSTNKINRIKIFNKYNSKISNNILSEFLQSLGYPYTDILMLKKRPVLTSNQHNIELATILKSKGLISKHKEEKDGIRIIAVYK
ncbi:hypothetical protein [Flavobacterium sp.]|uniref:YobI family P-loop NTPase n=1 Tax=Flavobacterium sp. TaxID=239 RepID=UPI00334179F6